MNIGQNGTPQDDADMANFRILTDQLVVLDQRIKMLSLERSALIVKMFERQKAEAGEGLDEHQKTQHAMDEMTRLTGFKRDRLFGFMSAANKAEKG